MTLRCFLFSSDEGTSDVIRQVLTGLGVEGESCSEASTAVEKVAKESFQLVVLDWDQQPEAGMLLSAARERRAAERPLTLAIVNDDLSVPKALQAGANSILRRPLILNQVTARDLIRSRQESSERTKAAAAGASVGAAPSAPASEASGKENPLRHGEFLQSMPVAPGGQYETETEQQSAGAEIDPLKDLEPVASAVPPAPVAPPPLPESDEPRGLEYYLKTRGGRQAAAPAPAAPSSGGVPELLGFDQPPTFSPRQSEPEPRRETRASQPDSTAHEQTKEKELFAYIDGESAEPKKAKRFGLGKGAIIAAMILAAIAIVAAPQAPWHPRLLSTISHGQKSFHAWMNPQPVTTPQAPAAHEDFGRAGDEYKLPVAENIPDATTDPSQISVVPVVDPTVKKPAVDASTPDQTVAPTDTTAATPNNPGQDPANQAATQPTPEVTQQPAGAVGISAPPATTVAPAQATTPHTETPTVVTPAPTPKPAPRQPEPYVPTTKVPSSLQSQMVTMRPDASGDKPPEAALPSIEPVSVSELAERALLSDQPPMPYPPNAGGRTGTVVLEVLIGRDGTVQDAKFLQGSLAFARTAIDGVKRWKFRPYSMNGRPVSVQTNLTIKFQPVQ